MWYTKGSQWKATASTWSTSIKRNRWKDNSWKMWCMKKSIEKQQHNICPEVTPNKPATRYGWCSLSKKSHLPKSKVTPSPESTPNSTRPVTAATVLPGTLLQLSLWEQKQDMAMCKTYQEVEHLVSRINMDHHFEVPDDVHHTREKFWTDNIAKHFYPTDAPQEMTPCHCHGDDNCFPRAISKLLFGTEEYCLAICATLVYEAVIHKKYYLDNI